jgi:hypothetical protein
MVWVRERTIPAVRSISVTWLFTAVPAVGSAGSQAGGAQYVQVHSAD